MDLYQTSLPKAALDASAPRRQALLLFASPLALDLGRRRWSSAWAPLLNASLAAAVRARPESADLHLFTDAVVLPAGDGAEVHRQQGRGFRERLEHAVATLTARGYAQVVVIGRDCPELAATDVAHAFSRLDAGDAAVLGPDHRGGCYLIGFQTEHADRLCRVTWQRGGDFEQLRMRFATLALSVLERKMDVDHRRDVVALGRLQGRIAALANEILAAAGSLLECALNGCAPVVESCRRAMRVRLQLPPPVAGI